MTYRLTVDPDAAALGLGNASAVVIASERPFTSAPLPREEIDAVVAAPGLCPSEDDGYHQVLAALGYPTVEPAGRRLVRVVGERGLRSHGLLVDACNMVALRHAAGIGLHDIGDRLNEDSELAVFRAAGTELMVPAFRDSARRIPAGDLVYGIRGQEGFEPLAWLGRRDTDAATGQIRAGTVRALVVVLGHGGLAAADTARMCDEVVEVVRRHQPGTALTRLAGTPARGVTAFSGETHP